jgi:putative FmdB family regulatory protein
MPLYECRCERCALTFEVLAPISAARMRSRPCPECGRAARRIISAVSFAVSESTSGAAAGDPVPRGQSRSDVTKLSVPPWARLCWMDDKSASRFAAYKHGRGAEYDDTVAAREETRKNRGAPADKPSADPHGHSPLSDPAVLARRRAAAARKQKVIESKEMLGKTPARPH